MRNMDLIKGKDIIIVGLQPWDTEIGSNCKNIALEFSKFNRVLYVNSPLDRITKLRHPLDIKVKKRIDMLKEKKQNLEMVSNNLWVYYPDILIESINWIKIDFLFDALNKNNNKRIANSIKKAIKVLDFKDYILFNDNDIFRGFYLKDYLSPVVSVYYSRDYLIGVDYWKFHGTRLEPKLMAKSDVCVANSSYLTEICKKYNNDSFYIGQGCELELFLSAKHQPSPVDIKEISQPRIGYVGVLSAIRLNLEIIMQIAKDRPQWSIVLVGPEDNDFKSSELHSLSNVYFLGAKDPKDLPAYINTFSVCINPQLVNELTIGNYPRKIDEYLASGKPVVATKTETMSEFKDHCYLATTKQEYTEFIQKSLESDSPNLARIRQEFASSHSWENSVSKIYQAIINYKTI